MARELQTSSPVALPAIDLREPSTLLLLPAWLESQIAAVSDLGAGRTIVDPLTRQITGRVATIPASKMPTGAQRRAIEQRVADLEAASRPGPVNRTLAILGELINEHAASRLDDETVSIKAEAYLDAVEDLPSWAVREAVRRWRRGEVSADPKDLDFAPKPARLRRIAQAIATVPVGQAQRLRRILDAEPEEPVSEAQAAENQRRYAEALKEAGVPDVQPAGSEAAERAEARRLLAQRFAEAEADRKAKIAERAA